MHFGSGIGNLGRLFIFGILISWRLGFIMAFGGVLVERLIDGVFGMRQQSSELALDPERLV